MVNFKETIIFQGSIGDPTFSWEGSNIFRGVGGGWGGGEGTQLLIPYRNPYSLCSSRGGGGA